MQHDYVPESMNYYRSLASDHRKKITFLSGIYIAFAQVLIFLPQSAVETFQQMTTSSQIIPNELLLVTGVGCLSLILLVGIFHHFGNMVTYSTLRMNCERKCLAAQYALNPFGWDRRFEAHLRTSASLSKPSGIIAGLLTLLFILVVAFRFGFLVTFLFSGSAYAIYFNGVFISCNVAVITFYWVAIKPRLKSFYQSRALLKCIEKSESDEKAITCIKDCSIEISEKDMRRYRSYSGLAQRTSANVPTKESTTDEVDSIVKSAMEDD